jgi:hypothetical protein
MMLVDRRALGVIFVRVPAQLMGKKNQRHAE